MVIVEKGRLTISQYSSRLPLKGGFYWYKYMRFELCFAQLVRPRQISDCKVTGSMLCSSEKHLMLIS